MNEVLAIVIIVVGVAGASLFVAWFANWMTKKNLYNDGVEE